MRRRRRRNAATFAMEVIALGEGETPDQTRNREDREDRLWKLEMERRREIIARERRSQ